MSARTLAAIWIRPYIQALILFPAPRVDRDLERGTGFLTVEVAWPVAWSRTDWANRGSFISRLTLESNFLSAAV